MGQRVVVLFLISCLILPVQVAQAGKLAGSERKTVMESTLDRLSESVVRLTRENQELAALNDRMRLQIKPLETELTALQGEEGRYAAQLSSMEARYQKRKEELKVFESRVGDLQGVLAGLEKEQEGLSGEVAAKEKAGLEIQERTRQLAGEIESLRDNKDLPPDPQGQLAGLIAQRDRLVQDLRSAEDSLKRTREEWAHLGQMSEAGPGRIENLRKEQGHLESALKVQQESLAVLQKKFADDERAFQADTTQEIGDEQFSALEKEVGELKARNRDLEAALVALQKGWMDKDREAAKTSLAEYRELKALYKKALEENRQLRAERSRLRPRMVDLDKKKSALERSIYKD
jgi:chromosome segregation ATPase